MTQTLNFKPVRRDSLFYGEWQYCISFTLSEISCLKQLNHEYIDDVIARRREWREISRHRLVRHNSKPGIATIIGKRFRDISDDVVANLHKIADYLIKSGNDFKLVTSVDTGWVYSNNLSLIKKLAKDPALEDKQYTEAVVNRPKDTIILKDAKHTHRSYLKSTKLSPEEKVNVHKFLLNQENVRASKALLEWFNSTYSRTQDYYFIDHNNDGVLLMLSLVNPKLIRKTIGIISAK